MAGKNINDATLQKITDFTNTLNRLYASAINSSTDGYIIIKELIDHILTLVPGGGDMLKSIYDSDNNGIIDNSELINGDTVANDAVVQANTGFRTTPSTIIDAGVNLSWDGNTLNSNESGAVSWGAISGTIEDQEDLQDELAEKQNIIDNSDDISEGDVNLYLTPSERINITTNNAKISYVDSLDVSLNTTHRSSDGKDHSDVVTNNAKITNVSTNLSIGTSTSVTVDINSSDGDNMTLIAADTDNAGLLTAEKFNDIETNNDKPSLKTAASGLPSTSGAGNIDMNRANDYYSETAITAAVTWGLTNIGIDKVSAIDVKVSTYSITLAQSGITFKGTINSSGVVQDLDVSKSNLIMLWAETSTIIWVSILKNEA